MCTLVFPGRHLAHTSFQTDLLFQLIGRRPEDVRHLLMPGEALPASPISRVVFVVTSANQEGSRYNPIPYALRTIGVDRFARDLAACLATRGVRFAQHIVGVPHYGHVDNFARYILKEVAHTEEPIGGASPQNTIVLCSTAELIGHFQALGYTVAPAELASPGAKRPIDYIQLLAETGTTTHAELLSGLAPATQALWRDYPSIPERIIRIYRDPLLTQQGEITPSRDHNIYARGMNEIVRLKYQDISRGIRPGRIVDEGCADGALLSLVASDFPDSDLFGIDLSAEFAARFNERQRSGGFGSNYVRFYQRNLFDPLFAPGSIDTTICNSTLHEIWSYGEGEKSVRRYLRQKFEQLAPGGRLLIRDVVGPEQPLTQVILRCSKDDGEAALPNPQDRSPAALSRLSTRARLDIFTEDFLAHRGGHHAPLTLTGRGLITTLQFAAEFLSKKDYTGNWRSEMHEEFCFWSFSQWVDALQETGFQVLRATPEMGDASRAYANPWIIENRWRGHVALLDPESGEALPWPQTNMVIFAEKPTN